jgi:DNA polymerase II large subunit
MIDFTCPICGLPMVHSRTRGYHCFYEAHEELKHEEDIKQVIKAMAKRAPLNEPMRVKRQPSYKATTGNK